MTGRTVTAYSAHPMIQYVRSLPQELYLTREAADQLGCSLRFLAYLRKRAEVPLGPTHKAQYGGIVIYLYTPERIAEIKKYRKQLAGPKPGSRRGPVPMWTRTERTHRRREQNRMVNCRIRAAELREQGRDEDAVEMEKTGAAIAATLEKSKIQRWEQVHGTPWSKK